MPCRCPSQMVRFRPVQQQLHGVPLHPLVAVHMAGTDLGCGEAGEFDLAWSMESGEHMPDKQKFVNELVRVTAPGGRIIIVTWCASSVERSSRRAVDVQALCMLLQGCLLLLAAYLLHCLSSELEGSTPLLRAQHMTPHA